MSKGRSLPRLAGIVFVVAAVAVTTRVFVHDQTVSDATVDVTSGKSELRSDSTRPKRVTSGSDSISGPEESASPSFDENVSTTSPQDTTTRTAREELSAAEIEWENLGLMASIPRALPNRTSDDPTDAGFSPLWAEYSLNGLYAGTPVIRGVSNDRRVLVGPLVFSIVSQLKRPDDQWAYEMERELRQIAASRLGATADSVSRIFCNAVGCLFYHEGGYESNPFAEVTGALRSEPLEHRFSIDPARIFWSGGRSERRENNWKLVIYVRDPAVPVEEMSEN